MTYVLRTTIDGFSAGTRVDVVSEQHTNEIDGRDSVLVWFPNASEATEIDRDNLVKLRNRSNIVPSVNRAQRRKFLNKLFGGN